MARERQWSWWRLWRTSPTRDNQGSWDCLAWTRGGCPWLPERRLQKGGVWSLLIHNKHQAWFRLDIKKNLITERVVQHWKRLPREVVELPALEAFKNHVHLVLEPMAWWWPWQCWANGWTWWSSSPFRLKWFCHSASLTSHLECCLGIAYPERARPGGPWDHLRSHVHHRPLIPLSYCSMGMVCWNQGSEMPPSPMAISFLETQASPWQIVNYLACKWTNKPPLCEACNFQRCFPSCVLKHTSKIPAPRIPQAEKILQDWGVFYKVQISKEIKQYQIVIFLLKWIFQDLLPQNQKELVWFFSSVYHIFWLLNSNRLKRVIVFPQKNKIILKTYYFWASRDT